MGPMKRTVRPRPAWMRRALLSLAAGLGVLGLGLALALFAASAIPAWSHGPSSAAGQPGTPEPTPPTAVPGVAQVRGTPTARRTMAAASDSGASLGDVTATPVEDEGAESGRVLIGGVPQGRQGLSLNCEFQSASDLAAYYGKIHDWQDVYDLVGDDPGGDPHKGFAGKSLNDPPGGLFPSGYGVYAEPIAQALQAFGLPAEVHYWEPGDWIRQQVSIGRPVIVWATAGMVPATPAAWTAADGAKILGARGEHTYLVVGYDADSIWVNDPWDGRQKTFAWGAFLQAWDLFDRMAVVVAASPQGSGG